MITAEAASRSGRIRVRATEGGVPTAVTIEPREMTRPPDELARDLLRLCRQAALRAQLERRRQHTEAGVEPTTLRLLGLPTHDEVARIEEEIESEYEHEPVSWFH
jgi:hypothetical protein